MNHVEKLSAWRIQGLTLLLMAAISACSDTVVLDDGVQAPDLPRQRATDAPPLQLGEFQLVPKASYDITAKVLSKRQYRWDDLAAIAPWDFALGWGALSDEAVLRPIKVAQGDRFMFWHLYDARIDINLVNRSSANVHLIPENSAIFRQISDIPEGAVVRLTGDLVDLHLPDKRRIPTSLSRRDVGPGACEILLVKTVALLRPTPENSIATSAENLM